MQLVKLDLQLKKTTWWKDEGFIPGEPVFVPSPEATGEDDGTVARRWPLTGMRTAKTPVFISKAMTGIGRFRRWPLTGLRTAKTPVFMSKAMIGIGRFRRGC